MTDRVAGKVALITGAGRGQGRSHALRLAEEGADIIAVDSCEDVATVPWPMASEADLEETAAGVRALGRRVVAEKVDVRDLGLLQNVVVDAVGELGRLDIVSANAGIGGFGLSWEIEDDSWQNMLDVNLTGVWHACKAAIPHILKGGRGGSIVLTSSVMGLKGCANASHYVASKHGVVGLMRCLAVELAPQMIRVNSIHPTQVNTNMIQNDVCRRLFVPDVPEPTQEQFAAVSQSMHLLPIPWVEAADISNALLFLVSDEARYITGATLPVDAGALLK